MVNLEHKLTVDDLIVEYMIYKVENGYEPSFTSSEFISFLYFFENKMPVEDTLYENKKLFERFFKRKGESDWNNSILKANQVIPHMDMIYLEKEDDYLIKANYRLSAYDKSVINTYFMEGHDNPRGKATQIRSIIGEYLLTEEKRNLDLEAEITEKEMLMGKYIAAHIIMNIWEKYINDLSFAYKWPKQCDDINKYLLDTDLATIIGVVSIKETLLEIYNIFSKRAAILYSQDKNLRISTYKNQYLARANYETLIQGYEKIMNHTFGIDKKSLDIDVTLATYRESNYIGLVYDWDDEPIEVTRNEKIKSSKIKKMIKNLDNQNK